MNKTSARRIEAQARRQQCVTLRRAGGSYQSIGDQLGITKKAAWSHVQKYLKEVRDKTTEDGEEVRIMEAERLDRLQLAIWARAIDGDITAIDKMLKIMERRAKLLGIDAPDKVAPTDPTGEVPYDPITDDERVQRLEAVYERVRSRRDREASILAAEGRPDPK